MLILLSLSCTSAADLKDGPKQESRQEQRTKVNDSMEVKAIIENKNWEAWTGIQAGRTMEEVDGEFPTLSKDWGESKIGADLVLTRFRVLEHANWFKPVRFWYIGNELILLDFQYPKIENGFDFFRDLLGEPAAQIDYYQRTLLYEKSAFVYPNKGIAILYNPDRSAIIRIYLFAPSNLEEYQSQLHHPMEAARRLQRR